MSPESTLSTRDTARQFRLGVKCLTTSLAFCRLPPLSSPRMNLRLHMDKNSTMSFNFRTIVSVVKETRTKQDSHAGGLFHAVPVKDHP